MILGAILLDQSPRHFPWVDFERPEPIPECDHGIAEYNLNTDTRLPVYAFGDNYSINKTVRNQTSYNTFWASSPYTQQILLNLTLTQTSVPNVYSYINNFYFPIDGQGWDVPKGTDEYLASGNGDGLYHNFHFCIQIHARFAYTGGETFTFLGDDDLWVFINNQLALDLGGPHTMQEAAFSLDDIATQFSLAVGNDYRFDFFYCERHTVLSQIEVTSDLQIYCAYFDWCDVCDGNGQSCCEPGDCDDGNACTTDLCAVLSPPNVACQNTPINCTASSVCVTAQCVASAGGCVETNITCPNDGNECTIEQCSPSQGGCIAPQKVCDDGQGLCTTKTCTPSTGNCSFTPVNCNDNNACTTDSCSTTAGCQHATIVCNDNNPCTTDTCSTATGCVYTPVNCNDSNACTADSCGSTGLCNNAPINCDDNDACTINNCITTSGCDFSQLVNCNDSNACTTDSCSTQSGCQHAAVSCDDNNLCTTDSCNTVTGCSNVPVNCTDNNPCTVDSCSPTSGCSHVQKNCDDNNACTNDGCGSSNNPNDPNYCTHTPVVCNDNNYCTNDSCANSSGCVYQPFTCNDNNVCTSDTCIPASGCSFTTINDCDVCFDGNTPLFNCSYTDHCHPIQCYVQSNGNPACEYYANVTCNDNNACTNDSCNSIDGSCTFAPVLCNDNNNCTLDSCNTTTGQCIFTPVNCNDNNNCTIDSCSAGYCSNVLVSPGCQVCGTGSCITTDYCNPLICSSQGQCVSQAINCDDKNACTQDSCLVLGVFNTSCLHPAVDCNTNLSSSVNACAPAFCSSSTGCYQQAITCDDGNPCTADSCVLVGSNNYTCQNIPICPTTDLCNPVTCNPTTLKCTVNPVNCNDNNPCTNDTCYVNSNNTAACSNIPYPLKQTDACHPAFCNTTTGDTYVVPVNCNDGILCTLDSCNLTTGVCSHLLNPCNDYNNCTVDSCSNTATSVDGCLHTPLVCQSTICNTATCDNHTGCVFTPIPCKVANVSNYCSASSCDETVGCLNSTRICVLSTIKSDPTHWLDPYPSLWNSAGQKSADCFNAVCDPTKQLCVVSKKSPWTAYCGAAYLTTAQKDATISASVIGGVVVAAIVFAALAGFGGKKGYDAWVRMRDERIQGAQGNPMYVAPKTSGTSPLYS